MASPPPDSPSLLSSKPSLRQRLFSSSSKKLSNTSQNHTSSNKHSPSTPDPHHGLENSTAASDQPLPSSTSSPHPNPPSSSTPHDTIPEDTDREQASMNTTLTSNRRVPFYRRKADKSATALSSTTSHSMVKPSPGPARSRPSFLSRVVYRVVPCVTSSPDGVHNTPVHPTSRTPEPTPSFPLKNLTGQRQPNAEPPSSDISNLDDLPLVPPLTIPTAKQTPQPSPTDSEIIVPAPATPQLLPPEETDGLTSGAVQPPGSTADQVARAHAHEVALEDAEGTSIDDDLEHRRMIQEQDEEERLIKNGGSGIPIGPVCIFYLDFSQFLPAYMCI
ncbi:hypothetical protein BDQ17DRAFT_125927 [Cyathus striatus]|nr:hypothetical protein BDQ17DRAFT_125927 [Cyathus striatus]